MENNNPDPHDPAPPAPAQAQGPRPIQRQNQRNPRPPAQTGLTRARDNLINNDRIISFGLTTRTYPRSVKLSESILTELVGIYAILFQSMWNQGFNSIVTGITSANMPRQCEAYARCYIHTFLCDLYSSNREVAQKESPSIFLAAYSQEMPRTGHHYDPFLRQMFNIFHPVLCDKCLEETLYYIDFNLDMSRKYDNWFNIPDVASDDDLTTSRAFAIIDTLNRSKTVSTSALQFGTKRGNGAILIDFYPRDKDAKEYAATWLNMDNNYIDDALVIMYILGTDLTDKRLGPTFETDKVPDKKVRDEFKPPFHAEFIEVEDLEGYGLNAYHENEKGDRVKKYSDAREQKAEYVQMYSRTWFFYRKKVLQTLTPADRFNAFKQIVEG